MTSFLELENTSYVFCVTRNGVVESCRYLTLLSWQPYRKSGSGETRVISRYRTRSLPPSFTDYPDPEAENECYDQIQTPRVPIRSLSSEDVPDFRMSIKQEDIHSDCNPKSGNKLNFKNADNRKLKSQSLENNAARTKRKKGPAKGLKKPTSKKATCGRQKKSSNGSRRIWTVLHMNGYMLSCFVSELKRSQVLRKSFIYRWGGEQSVLGNTNPSSTFSVEMLVFVAFMTEPECEFLDRLGNKMVNSNILFRRSLEHALSWLSTLGGAFSALGDLSASYAEEAGHVSITQLRIAMKLGDPGIQSRCRLYAAISLLQRGYLKSCRDIVRNEYRYATSALGGADPRLRRMCLGIWAKLQYHWKLFAMSDKKMLKSTMDGLKDIENNTKYRNVYDLEEGRKVAPFEDKSG